MRNIHQFLIINLTFLNGIYGFVIINPCSQTSTGRVVKNHGIFASPAKDDKDGSDDTSGSKKNYVPDAILREEWAQDLASGGGDPSFLPDGFDDEDDWYGDATDDADDAAEMPSMELLSMGGMTSPALLNVLGKEKAASDGEEEGIDEEEEEEESEKFVWDGTIDEDAYYE
jgi:hypothetical protein